MLFFSINTEEMFNSSNRPCSRKLKRTVKACPIFSRRKYGSNLKELYYLKRKAY